MSDSSAARGTGVAFVRRAYCKQRVGPHVSGQLARDACGVAGGVTDSRKHGDVARLGVGLHLWCDRA